MKNKYITIEQLAFRYEETPILKGVSFSIDKGEKIAILGANGSGKSTLMKLLAGLEKPESGQIMVENEVITADNNEKLRKLSGIVFQNPNDQFVGSTVVDDIAFGLENHRIAHEKMELIIDEALETFNLTAFAKHDPASLSGGQKQRAAIAAVAVLKPKILIFDESTSMLDPKHREHFFKTVELMKNQNPNQIQLMITHDLNEILYFDRVIVIGEQTVVFDGELNCFLTLPEETLQKWNLDLPYALKTARNLASDIAEIKKHYFAILQKTHV